MFHSSWREAKKHQGFFLRWQNTNVFTLLFPSVAPLRALASFSQREKDYPVFAIALRYDSPVSVFSSQN
jgi:hypothetical protein